MENLENKRINLPVALTVAGLDPSGGAGIIADIKTFTAFGCFPTAAISAITFQNTVGVFGAIPQTAETVRGQIVPIVEDFPISAVKTGMLPSREVIAEVARLIKEFSLKNVVVDPVVRSTSGFDLIDDVALKALIELLFPLAVVVTPNIAEAERIVGFSIQNVTDIEKAAMKMQSFGAKNVLIKGGHLSLSELGIGISDLENESLNLTKIEKRKAKDFLSEADKLTTFETDYIETNATHGTGCTLAAAIAANLAQEKSLTNAVQSAKDFVTQAIKTAPLLGKGHSPINHGFSAI